MAHRSLDRLDKKILHLISEDARIPVAAGLTLTTLLGGNVDGGFAVSSRLTAMVSMVLIGVVMSAAYFGLLLVMRSGELTAFLAPLQRRFGR